jgi:ParB-like chromosome segregation protein Spo0J
MSNENLVPNLKIVELPVDALTPYKNNAKKHTPKQIEQIGNSIAQWGFNDPIGVYGPENLVIEGHGRLEAAKRLGMKEVPCIRLDHLEKEEDRRAYLLSHNQLNLMTGWDSNLLGNELEGLLHLDFEMRDFGFDSKLFSNFSKTSVSVQPQNSEIPLNAFEEQYAHECPSCGFKYN